MLTTRMKKTGESEVSNTFLHRLLRAFLGDTETLWETFDTVLPILEEEDEERRREYKEAKKLLEQHSSATGDIPPQNLPRLIEAAGLIRKHERRFRRARVLFQG